MTDDVVAELDEWLEREATTLHHYPNDDVDTGLLERARDEIVALRAKCIELSADRTRQLVADRRAKVLEEAARLCDRIGLDGFASDGAAAIRALKDKHDE